MDEDSGDGLLVEAAAGKGWWGRWPWFVNQAIVPIEAAAPPTTFVSLERVVVARQFFKFCQVPRGIDVRKPCFDFFRLNPPTVALQQAIILEFLFEFFLEVED